ncbi:L,D-transpeptidase family protein [Pullulanibacillus sp. KACC 23026]|uniref:L,D-transpeptidase family protein n=1 Tax=Pullulanibacillus sp. KACC 23026 TaxID=3028315 RepID=UPI0023B001D5|nr:L,D-transpeptidase family protein [Pullulanibacillus sp. KACC 23026]WEG14786.1 L,D-transpeptidase family protein [Pullulanibacillus sp. KACC 23026]
MKKGVFVVSGSFVLLVIIVLAGLSYFQMTHFNSNVLINGTNVGGMTASKALDTLESAVSKNTVYIGDQKVYDGKDTNMGFTSDDMSGVKALLKEQRTFFPSSKPIRYSLKPKKINSEQIKTMEADLKKKLLAMNKGLQAPKDASAQLEQGKIVVTKSVPGNQYDVNGMLKAYEKQAYNSVVRLNRLYLKPVGKNSPVIKKEKQQLADLAKQTVSYKVQDKVYTFKGSDLSATVSKEGKLVIDPTNIKTKLDGINASQSTLDKGYTFKTHSGSVIQVEGGTYGWALNVDAEAKRIEEAFMKKESSILAYNVYGKGWSTVGVGYHVTTNHGIGDTYVEVSIKDQHIWVYKDGKLKVSTNVVTGTHIYNEDTPKGVWYIEYKQSPSTLKGSEVGNSNYSVHVNYWAPFTLGGVGFHDASWRTNWSSDAYIKYGSGGCVNTPPSVMKSVYDNLEQNEPVIVY